MTWFFPDLNVWLALSDIGHAHNADAWQWLNLLPQEVRLIFSRYTQLGLLRLLTNQSTMGEATLTLKKAWDVYDHWLEDVRVQFIRSRAAWMLRSGKQSHLSRAKRPPSWLETATCSRMQNSATPHSLRSIEHYTISRANNTAQRFNLVEAARLSKIR